MEQAFWHGRWENNEIGFHEDGGNPFLKKYIDTLCDNPNPRILVPLCGKTHDIGILLANGCEVIGVELSEIAVQQLFDEMNVTPDVTDAGEFKRYTYDTLTILQGDVFSLTQDMVGGITGVYDRAALVALPENMREDYAKLICQIAADATQLVVTFEYHQPDMDGPPFSVTQEMVRALYKHQYMISPLQRRPVEGGLKGEVAADCLVFALTPTPNL